MINRQNYTARIEQKKKNRLTAGLVSERFPQVEGMVINMTYYQKVSNPILMVRTINVLPRDYAYFKMDCMIKGCTNGGFDLTPIISGLIKNRKPAGSGNMECKGKTDVPSKGHASISYEITISYMTAGKKSAAVEPALKKPVETKPLLKQHVVKKTDAAKKTDGKRPAAKKTVTKKPAKTARRT